jgi:hypothetical protein
LLRTVGMCNSLLCTDSGNIRHNSRGIFDVTEGTCVVTLGTCAVTQGTFGVSACRKIGLRCCPGLEGILVVRLAGVSVRAPADSY